MARGAVVMSNIFLASSFIFLASEQAGCLNEEEDEVLDDCDERVYGFKPSSFISNIAIISGVLSALFMPLFGAMIDYTSHRRTVGAVSALCVMLIQAAQIGTVSATWLVMALLQALSGFLYQIQVLAAYAFLPEISRIVGEEKMTKRTCVRWNLVVLSLLILPSHLFVRRYCHLRHGAVCHASILFGRCYCYFLRLGLGYRGDEPIESGRQYTSVFAIIFDRLEALTACPGQAHLTRRTIFDYNRICASLSHSQEHQPTIQSWSSLVLFGAYIGRIIH
jgi:MFS family permease